jgi:hypothetical protein
VAATFYYRGILGKTSMPAFGYPGPSNEPYLSNKVLIQIFDNLAQTFPLITVRQFPDSLLET